MTDLLTSVEIVARSVTANGLTSHTNATVLQVPIYDGK